MVYRLLAELQASRSLYLPWKPIGQQWLAPAHIRPAVKAARSAFRDDLHDRYVTKMSEVRKAELAISTLLDPHYKDYSFTGALSAERDWAINLFKSEFEVNWQPAEAEAAEAAPAPAPTQAASSSSTPAPTSALGIFDRPMDPADAGVPEVVAVPIQSDLEKYLLLPQEPLGTDVLAWWKKRDHALSADSDSGRTEGLPHLAHMARQWLGCPATSAGVERLFSKAGSMHHDLKGSMEDGSLEHSLIATANTE